VKLSLVFALGRGPLAAYSTRVPPGAIDAVAEAARDVALVSATVPRR
jgi:hypothetical protein